MINLGDVAFREGDYDTASAHWHAFLAFWRERGSDEGIGLASLNLGHAALRTGRFEEAQSHFDQAFLHFDALGFREHIGHALLGHAAVSAAQEEPDRAGRPLRAALGILDEVGSDPQSFDPALAGETEATLRLQLTDREPEQVLAAGRTRGSHVLSPC